jgi:hypothetical protein
VEFRGIERPMTVVRISSPRHAAAEQTRPLASGGQTREEAGG